MKTGADMHVWQVEVALELSSSILNFTLLFGLHLQDYWLTAKRRIRLWRAFKLPETSCHYFQQKERQKMLMRYYAQKLWQ